MLVLDVSFEQSDVTCVDGVDGSTILPKSTLKSIHHTDSHLSSVTGSLPGSLITISSFLYGLPKTSCLIVSDLWLL